MFEIKTNTGETVLSEGETLLESLQKAGIYLTASCGGKGICGKCKVRVAQGKIRVNSFLNISENEKKLGYVLACQSFPESEILLELPEKLITVTERISTAKVDVVYNFFKKNPTLLNPLVKKIHIKVQPPQLENPEGDLERVKKALGVELLFSREFIELLPEVLRENNWSLTVVVTQKEVIDYLISGNKLYGVAVDIGTTTVVVALVDLEKNELIEFASCYNSQILYGDDVITRIIYATEAPRGLEILRRCIVDDINALVNTLTVRNKEGRVFVICIAGNTTMTHLFWGINPNYIRQEPYVPVLNHYPYWKAKDAELILDSQIPIYTIPSVAGFIGGDIVAGLLACQMHNEEDICLFIDIGTNGEIVVGNKDWLIAASTSAGPCFEGSGISCGMRATQGAIEAMKYNKASDTVELKVIGESKPIGICGSGVIDIVSELFENGIVDQKGKFIPNSSKRIRFINEEFAFFISDNCYITQSDIDNIVRSKAAIYAGVSTLLREVGLNEKDISKIYIAGGFGEFLDIQKAVKIGMLPNLPKDRYIFVGNASLTGAILCLMSSNLLKIAEELADKITYFDLSSSKRFTDEYLSALFIPHTERERFLS
ncbi:MAG: ASKHA domain-containing protein [Thermodesulfovibrionaceae bacterium]